MQTKLTLRMEETLVKKAKKAAARRGKSVSQMVGEFFDAIDVPAEVSVELPPVTKSLLGIIENKDLDETAYKDHLAEKHR